MTKKTGLNWWSYRAWIYFGSIISAVMFIAILIGWNTWSTSLKVIAAIAAVLIPIHVVEEWIFPGGFHYQYNVGLNKSEVPNRYPLCRASDMFTNLLATFLYIGLTIYCLINNGNVNPGILLGTALFCLIELVMHTLMGFKMYLKFKSNGKTIIYGPGSITAYWCFVPLGVISIIELIGQTFNMSDWFFCVGILLFILVFCILLPENILKKKNSIYSFDDAGYFEKFLK